jgi:chaperonin GroEL (HSP60 family)
MEKVISSRINRLNGKDTWRQNLRTVIYASDKVRPCFGPKGSYKMVTYNRGPEQVIKITKDPIAILDELAIQYPPAVIVSESAKLQREEAGDGVTAFVVFLSSLLRKADELLSMGVHANTIIHGYYLATNKALEVLDKLALNIDGLSNKIVATVDCGRKLLTSNMCSMITQAYPYAFTDGRFEKENIRFVKQTGGSLKDSKLIHGIVVKKEKAHPNMPTNMKNLRIAITSERLGIDRLEVKMRGEGATPIMLNVQNAKQMGEYKEEENELKTKCIEKLADLKVNVLLCEQPIEEMQKDKLFDHGIFALERIDKKDSQAIAKATGAQIVGSLKELLEQDIGTADELWSERVELEKLTTIQGCKGATFLLRGNVPQAIDELETAIQKSLTVLKLADADSRVLPGGGAIEAHIVEGLKGYAKTFSGREQIVIEAFSNALMDIPRSLAENYGLNATDIILELIKHHAEGAANYEVGEQGCCDNVCFEPIKVKRSVIRRAYEVSALLLRIDELLISKEIPKFHKK